MSDEPQSLPQADLSAVLASYLQAVDDGQSPNPDALLERYPHLADDLRAFLAAERRLAPFADPRVTPDYRGETVSALGDPTLRDEPLAAGALFGDYELLEMIGEGGMGVVYRARHRQLKRTVALKLILSGRHASPSERNRFRIEAEAAARLSHPGIVQVFEVGEHDGLPFLATEYCDGGSLAVKLAGKPVPAMEAARVIVELADAVQAAHDGQVIHRDLKPANVLLTSDGRHKIGDFGLAKQLDTIEVLTRTNAILGSPPYMSPEQAEGKGATAGRPTDVYSLGAILYEMLTGRPPFRGATPTETLLQVVRDEPVPPRRLNRAVPRDLETICLRCLEKTPAKRFSTARDLGNELGRFLRGQPIQSRPIGVSGRAWRWCRRNPVVTGLLTVVCLTLTAGATVSTYYAIKAAERARAENIARSAAETARAAADNAAADAKAAEDRAIRERDAAIYQRYAADCARFQIAWEQKDFGRLHELLNRWLPKPDLPDPRGWEWHYLRQQCDRRMTVLEGHSLQVNAVAWHPEGRLLASGSSDGRVKVWNPDARECIHDYAGHRSGVSDVAWHPAGRRVASCGHDSSVLVWDMDRGETQFRIKKAHDTPWVDAIDWSPDGRRLASTGLDGKVRIWHGETGEPLGVLDLKGEGKARLKWSHDGRSLAASRWRELVIWDTTTWQETARSQVSDSIGECIAWSPDDHSLALGFVFSSIWDARTAKPILTLAQPGWVLSLAWNSQGLIAAASRDQTVGVWNPQSGQGLGMFRMHAGVVRSVAWSPDGEQLASAGTDGTVRVYAWNPKPTTSQVVQRGAGRGFECVGLAWVAQDARLVIVHPNHVKGWSPKSEAFEYQKTINPGGLLTAVTSPDRKRMALVTREGECILFDPELGRVVTRYRASVGRRNFPTSCVGFNSTGKLLAGASAFVKLHVWEAETGTPVAFHTSTGDATFSLDWHPRLDRFAVAGQPTTVQVVNVENGPIRRTDHNILELYRVKYSPDGQLLAIGGLEGQVVIFDAESGKTRHTLRGHAKPVLALAWTADGRRLVSGSEDRTIRIWDVGTGEELLVLRGHSATVTTLALDRESNRLASGDFSGEVRLWTIVAPERRPASETNALRSPGLRRSIGHTGTIRDIAISTDGKLAASCSGWPSSDGTIRIWDVRTGTEIRQLMGPTGDISAVRFVGNGHNVAAVGSDRLLRIWNADTGTLLQQFTGLTRYVHALDISADGLFAATGSDGRSITWWDLEKGQRLKTWKPPIPDNSRILAVAISTDGKRVLAGGDTGSLFHIELETGRVLNRFPHGARIEGVAFSPDGTAAVSSCINGRIALWELRSGTLIREFRGHESGVLEVTFNRDGTHLASASKDGTVRIWETSTGQELRTYRGKGDWFSAVRFTPDGQKVFAGGGNKDDFDLYVWEVRERIEHLPKE